MKDYSTENIINIAITGHATTGKKRADATGDYQAWTPSE